MWPRALAAGRRLEIARFKARGERRRLTKTLRHTVFTPNNRPSTARRSGHHTFGNGKMDDDEIVKEFLVESHENLDQLDQDLVNLEADPTNPEILSSIFRTIHTIKGTCGFLGFTKLEWVTHVGENLLSRLREGELQLNAEITTALLSLGDAVRQILGNIETTAREGDTDYASLVATLTRFIGRLGAFERVCTVSRQRSV